MIQDGYLLSRQRLWNYPGTITIHTTEDWGFDLGFYQPQSADLQPWGVVSL